MKRKRLVVTALVVLSLVAIPAALGVTALLWPATPPPSPFTKGERLRYAVSYMGIAAGTLDLVAMKEETSNGADCFIVEMRITSANTIVEKFVKIRESWRSTVDREGVFSRGFELSRLHKGKTIADEQSNDYTAGVSRWKRVEEEGESKGEIPLSGPAQDPVSWLYYCRSQIAKGEREIRFVVVQRNSARASELLVTGEEDIDLGPLGKIRALRASGSVGFGGLGASKKQNVDQKASVLWFDIATGILLKAHIAFKLAPIELVLIEAKDAPRLGGSP